MKKFLISTLLVMSAMAMTVADANAKRLGGGGSIGRQSSTVSRQASPSNQQNSAYNQARPNAPANAAPAAIPAKPASPWKGIVGGLVGGALLGAALSHFGLGGAMGGALGSLLTMALLAFAAYFIFNLFRRKSAVAGAPSGSMFAPSPVADIGAQPQAYPGYAANNNNNNNASSFNAVPNVPAAPWGVPADFDVSSFLRNAKTYFIRLQAAWDKADINDIREFTTTEMYAEIKLQVQERGASPNVTDVISIEAELLGLETIGNDYLASVKFHGMIKEDPNAPATAFNEVWNLSKPVNAQGGWVLAGIQQL